ncbi:hypothetical protein MRB53_039230 [Persea americana]|nr:hypothetical protein MRB53_039230 [Persea americana]
MLSTKDLGTCEVYPSKLQHSPNGRFVAVCGDGEYIIYTALAWRNKAFGAATSFRATGARQCWFRHGKTIFGGALLGVKGSDWVSFYDWNSGSLVRRIDVGGCTDVFWSEDGRLDGTYHEEAFYVLALIGKRMLMSLKAVPLQKMNLEWRTPLKS